MKPTLLIRPEAEADLREACDWYEAQRSGLGDDLLMSVEETLERIRTSPEMAPVVYREVRQKLVRRFPIAVYFESGETRIAVLAIFHASRDPGAWKARAD